MMKYMFTMLYLIIGYILMGCSKDYNGVPTSLCQNIVVIPVGTTFQIYTIQTLCTQPIKQKDSINNE